MLVTRTATCNCGSVQVVANGPPIRVGLCHCITCRNYCKEKDSGGVGV